jgi:cation-transporting ATPase 13A1
VLLRGGAVVNESTLTGESVPQLKDPIAVDAACSDEPLDIKSKHRVHTLYSGTQLMQSTAANAGASTAGASAITSDAPDAPDAGGAMVNVADVPPPPDGGCVCFVLSTAFSSSQGELMRMIEFSTAKVTADKKETLGLLLLLLTFALAAAGYVLHRGLIEGKKTQYELVLKCVLIITSVVPPELPMQTALAVNTALMALMKAQVFCTEPYRVPYAGRLTHTLFDKTGTLTTDELTVRGVVNATAPAEGGGSGGARSVQSVSSASAEMCCVIGGCHSLLQVDGKLMGDPIELAAVRCTRRLPALAPTGHLPVTSCPAPAAPAPAAPLPLSVRFVPPLSCRISCATSSRGARSSRLDLRRCERDCERPRPSSQARRCHQNRRSSSPRRA